MSRVGLFCPNLRGGGAQRVMVIVANELAARGHTVELLAIDEKGPFRDRVDSAVTIRCLAADRIRYALSDLIEYIETAEPRVLLATLNGASIVSVSACRLADQPVRCVVRIPSMPHRASDMPIAKKWLITTLSGLVFRWADQLVAISHGLATEFKTMYRFPAEKVTTIYNPAYDTEIDTLVKQPVAHPWFDSDNPVILGVGRLVPIKDFGTLLRAVAQLRETTPAKLVLLGDGPEEVTLRELATELGISEHVAFLGFVDNPYKYMRAADIFVLSSLAEGFGNVIVEALVCETDIVATDCPGGPREILEDGKWGRLVEPGNHQELCAQMRQTLSSPADGQQLRSRAEVFAVETIVDQYETVLLP